MNKSPSTIGYELQCGTPTYSDRVNKPSYSAKRGVAVYRKNHSRCRRFKGKPRLHKRKYLKSIKACSKEVAERIVFGHWESDIVLGLKKKDESILFTIVE